MLSWRIIFQGEDQMTHSRRNYTASVKTGTFLCECGCRQHFIASYTTRMPRYANPDHQKKAQNARRRSRYRIMVINRVGGQSSRALGSRSTSGRLPTMPEGGGEARRGGERLVTPSSIFDGQTGIRLRERLSALNKTLASLLRVDKDRA